MTTSPRGFADLGVPSDLCARLDRAGISAPFEIQAAVIPDALAGRDVVGRAPTGSGKTLAFGLPLVANLTSASNRRPTALVLAPTRELADQIANELRPFAKARNHQVLAVYGGVGYGAQRKGLDSGSELVVACPGRLEDLLQMGAINLGHVRQVVLDEADRMADMGFLPAVKRILALVHPERQVLLFSATLDGAVGKLTAAVQRNAVVHQIGPEGPDMSAAHHVFWHSTREERIDHAAAAIRALGPTMVFTRTRHGADRVARQLARAGVTAAPIHGGRSQPQRDRALRAFSSGEVQSLIATDVAARGVHVDGVAGVVHFDPPADGATYIHRSGRTARAGAHGVVVSLVEPGVDKAVRQIQREVGIDVRVGRFEVADLGATGAVARPAATRDTAPREHAVREHRPSREPRRERNERPAREGRPARAERGVRAERPARDQREAHRPDVSASRPFVATPGRHLGTIKFFHGGRGYGFIERPDGQDLFVHHSSVDGMAARLATGQQVEFEMRSGAKGPEAFDVRTV